MMYKKCELCDYEDDVDYLHLLYDGRGNDYVVICEKCRNKIFSRSECKKKEHLLNCVNNFKFECKADLHEPSEMC